MIEKKQITTSNLPNVYKNRKGLVINTFPTKPVKYELHSQKSFFKKRIQWLKNTTEENIFFF